MAKVVEHETALRIRTELDKARGPETPDYVAAIVRAFDLLLSEIERPQPPSGT